MTAPENTRERVAVRRYEGGWMPTDPLTDGER